MRRILDGKTYDTKTAEEIASWSFSTPGDFHYCEETLHRTKKGAFFLYGRGGAMSAYASDLGNNNTGGGECLWPVSEEEAQEFCAKHNPAKAEKLWQYEEA